MTSPTHPVAPLLDLTDWIKNMPTTTELAAHHHLAKIMIAAHADQISAHIASGWSDKRNDVAAAYQALAHQIRKLPPPPEPKTEIPGQTTVEEQLDPDQTPLLTPDEWNEMEP